jgi:hypothetical protein
MAVRAAALLAQPDLVGSLIDGDERLWPGQSPTPQSRRHRTISAASSHDEVREEVGEIALDRLDFRGERSEALLIDNRADRVRAWEATGGAGYWFRTDDEFSREFPALLGAD